MTDQLPNPTQSAAMTEDERLAWLRNTAARLNLSQTDISRYTGYSYSSVVGWFTTVESIRHRPIPARAIDRMVLELKQGNVRGSK